MSHRFQAMQTEIERRWATHEVAWWGYSRPIGDDEVVNGEWYRRGDSAVFWFYRLADEDPGDIFVHLALAPESRSSAQTRTLYTVIRALAEIHGGHRLRFVAGEDFEPMAGYLRRLGWYETDDGLAVDLGR